MSRSIVRAPYLAACLATLVTLAPAVVHAQGAGKQAAAQALFEDAKKLMIKGNFPAACQKFSDSQNLDPAPGTQFNLADCYEKGGQTASAWATFKSAAASYRAHNRADWETKARGRATALEPKLSKLTVVIPPTSAVPGLEVKSDGQTLSPSELGAPIPVDPGDHVIEASAPGKKPWKTTAKVTPTPGEQKVSVGPLENDAKPPVAVVPAPTTAPPTTPPPATVASDTPPPNKGSGQKTAGYVALGVGGVGLVVGGVTGVMALSKNKTANDACPNDGACANAAAVDANSSAKSLATISTVGFIVGGVGLAAGIILLATAPSSTPKTGSIHVLPTAGPGGGGLAAFGTF